MKRYLNSVTVYRSNVFLEKQLESFERKYHNAINLYTIKRYQTACNIFYLHTTRKLASNLWSPMRLSLEEPSADSTNSRGLFSLDTTCALDLCIGITARVSYLYIAYDLAVCINDTAAYTDSEHWVANVISAISDKVELKFMCEVIKLSFP